MKHTPGPWQILSQMNGLDVITDENCRHVATASDSKPEYAANCRLIAAAPDLLEASKAMVKKIVDCGLGFNVEGFAKIGNRLNEAIAKAEGKMAPKEESEETALRS